MASTHHGYVIRPLPGDAWAVTSPDGHQVAVATSRAEAERLIEHLLHLLDDEALSTPYLTTWGPLAP